jgi:hypothetical protein
MTGEPTVIHTDVQRYLIPKLEMNKTGEKGAIVLMHPKENTIIAFLRSIPV